MKPMTITVQMQGHWITITWHEDCKGTSVYVDGKPLHHPDNKDLEFSNLSIAAVAATPEQIEYIHKQNALYEDAVIKSLMNNGCSNGGAG